MNLFTGLTPDQIKSFFIVGGIFSAYAFLVVVSLVAFYVASKPQAGRASKSALWHIVALGWFCLAVMSTVWGAPAEKSFFNDSDRTFKMVLGMIFAAIGFVCLAIGLLALLRQRRQTTVPAT